MNRCLLLVAAIGCYIASCQAGVIVHVDKAPNGGASQIAIEAVNKNLNANQIQLNSPNLHDPTDNNVATVPPTVETTTAAAVTTTEAATPGLRRGFLPDQTPHRLRSAAAPAESDTFVAPQIPHVRCIDTNDIVTCRTLTSGCDANEKRYPDYGYYVSEANCLAVRRDVVPADLMTELNFADAWQFLIDQGVRMVSEMTTSEFDTASIDLEPDETTSPELAWIDFVYYNDGTGVVKFRNSSGKLFTLADLWTVIWAPSEPQLANGNCVALAKQPDTTFQLKMVDCMSKIRFVMVEDFAVDVEALRKLKY